MRILLSRATLIVEREKWKEISIEWGPQKNKTSLKSWCALSGHKWLTLQCHSTAALWFCVARHKSLTYFFFWQLERRGSFIPEVRSCFNAPCCVTVSLCLAHYVQSATSKLSVSIYKVIVSTNKCTSTLCLTDYFAYSYLGASIGASI